MKKPVIKFSHQYEKMLSFAPFFEKGALVAWTFVADVDELPKEFLWWDTLYHDKHWNYHNYGLPKGKVIVLLLLQRGGAHEMSMAHFWTTLRKWTPKKETYYRSLIGQEVEIEITPS